MGVDKANGGEDTNVAAIPDCSSASVKRIVSSSHFATKKAAELSEI